LDEKEAGHREAISYQPSAISQTHGGPLTPIHGSSDRSPKTNQTTLSWSATCLMAWFG